MSLHLTVLCVLQMALDPTHSYAWKQSSDPLAIFLKDVEKASLQATFAFLVGTAVDRARQVREEEARKAKRESELGTMEESGGHRVGVDGDGERHTLLEKKTSHNTHTHTAFTMGQEKKAAPDADEFSPWKQQYCGLGTAVYQIALTWGFIIMQWGTIGLDMTGQMIRNAQKDG